MNEPIYKNVKSTFTPAPCEVASSSEPKTSKKDFRFFTFRQNNSGGRFNQDENVDVFVIIAAESPQDANARAQSIGIYFNGVNDGIDCQCCGSRWYELYSTEHGNEEPLVYDMTPEDYVSKRKGGHGIIIYYPDGSRRKVEHIYSCQKR